jgi:hypothetical protein
LQQKGDNHDDGCVKENPAQQSMAERRIWRLVIRRPGKGLFPVSLGNLGRSDPLERYPGSISPNASLARDGISQL